MPFRCKYMLLYASLWDVNYYMKVTALIHQVLSEVI